MRTIVLSDVHGFASLLHNALEHAGFGGGDSLVVAGDLVDIGPDDCIAVAEKYGATVLAGNHEVSAALGVDIIPQNPETPAKGPEFARRFLSGEWPLAAEVEGWVITHAGVSAMLLDDEPESARGDAKVLAERLNAAFLAEMERFAREDLSVWGAGRSRIIGSEYGPMWFRPRRLEWVPMGLRQIAGHTPREAFLSDDLAALERRGMLLIDPRARDAAETRARFRYAIIEDGAARLYEGSLA